MSYEEIQAAKEVKCSKVHCCGWCGWQIKEGEKAISRAYKWEGDFHYEHQHPECYRAMIASSGDIEDGYEVGQFERGMTAQEWEEREHA